MSVPLNDIKALASAVTSKTAAVIIEPIQGEGGIRAADPAYLRAVRELCDREKVLLIFDEVQTGMGRTGTMFAFQSLGVTPDAMTIAKSLGGGVPIAALVAKKEIADTLGPGTHGTTFGGSPLACAAALATFEAIEEEGLLENAAAMGASLKKKLDALQAKHPSAVTEIRGIGLMLGMELAGNGKPVFDACLSEGIIVNVTQGNVVRIMPPLIVTEKEIDRVVEVIDKALAEEDS